MLRMKFNIYRIILFPLCMLTLSFDAIISSFRNHNPKYFLKYGNDMCRKFKIKYKWEVQDGLFQGKVLRLPYRVYYGYPI